MGATEIFFLRRERALSPVSGSLLGLKRVFRTYKQVVIDNLHYRAAMLGRPLLPAAPFLIEFIRPNAKRTVSRN